MNRRERRQMKMMGIDMSREGIHIDAEGYEIATLLCDDLVWREYPVHHLIAEAHVPNPNNYTKVRHKDGNKRNNHATNLEWYE